MIPVPETTIGKIQSDSSSNLLIYINITSKDVHNAYVNECMELGFVIEYNKSENNYHAYDIHHHSLSVKYEGNQIMSIHLTRSSNSYDDVATKQPEKDDQALINGMHPEFKEAMDSYEAFIDEYCEFMKKYAATTSPDTNLVTDYANYINKYKETMNAFEAWKSKEMNEVETAYYLEVQTRVTQKLLDASISMNHFSQGPIYLGLFISYMIRVLIFDIDI